MPMPLIFLFKSVLPELIFPPAELKRHFVQRQPLCIVQFVKTKMILFYNNDLKIEKGTLLRAIYSFAMLCLYIEF